jgi:acyl-homoserine lactone acylase PvdQ
MMSPERQIIPASVPGAGGAVGVADSARQTAARLSALFIADQRLCERLNDAGHQLAGACEQLDGLDADHQVAVAGATIRRAFWDYQQAGEQRRQLAVDVGELSQQLTDLLRAVGFSEHDARRADVHALARANSGRGPGR